MAILKFFLYITLPYTCRAVHYYKFPRIRKDLRNSKAYILLYSDLLYDSELI